jgi:ATP-dependent exoDNAse (exonuclease V) beta subunit
MTAKLKVVDAAERLRALEPAESFIVQAPAGSGKTELLTQRFLRLLATVDEPEQVLAITFTRKAAAEMRDRILLALRAAQAPAPEQAHELQTWQLAAAALERDIDCGWGLLASPSRLRVQTIDGLCGSLVRQMPVLSRLGGSPATVDDARPLHQEAAERVIREALSSNERELQEAGKAVLVHLDGRFSRAIDLLATMLGKRDQWLRHLAAGADSVAPAEYFQQVLVAVTEQALTAIDKTLDPEQRQAIVNLCTVAAGNLETDQRLPELYAWRRVMADEAGSDWHTAADALPLWLGGAQCLLTNEGSYRSPRGLNKNIGFPAGAAGKALKEQHAELVLSLEESAPNFARQLQKLRGLPSGQRLEQELAVLPAMATLLKAAVAELKLLFAERNEVDHAEVTEMALAALGETDSPTDLALALDYQICHVLADEVQDTSHNQFELFRRLTAGWQVGDGRSFFAVGDPMQSIYRFREADVGLFLQAWHQGLGPDLPLTSLQLKVNFRSQAGIVDWVNGQFQQAFPEAEDALLGAIPYAQSAAFHQPLDGQAVSLHLRHKQQPETETEQMLAVLREAQADANVSSIAILGRGRGHVAEIVQALRAEGIPYRAVELEPLGSKAVVSDLMQLTRALLTPADRLAWLSVLRAPYCGLSLADLLQLVDDDKDSTVLSLIEQRLTELSSDGQTRLARLLDNLFVAEPSLAARVERLWFCMGGPALLAADDLEAAQLYLRTLAELENNGRSLGQLDSVNDLERAVAGLYAPPLNHADCKIDVMTMHKSKGLQFDVVLLPALHKGTPADDTPLLNLETLTLASGEHVLLAPLTGRSRDERQGSIYQWLQDLNADKTRYEAVRLLYVAATRAKQRLHLFASLAPNAKQQIKPPSGALISALWDGLLAQVKLPAVDEVLEELEPSTKAPAFYRKAADAACAAVPAAVVWQAADAVVARQAETLEFEWASPAAMLVGTVLHGLLQAVAEQGLARWQQKLAAGGWPRLALAVKANLQQQGLSGNELEAAVAKVHSGLLNALEDETGQWILSEHEAAVCEQAFGHVDAHGQLRHSIVDRSFVADGVRWIVDYKTGGHEGGNIEGFLAAEKERYAEQLQRYGDIYAQLETRPIKLALYLPLLKRMVAWDYVGDGVGEGVAS